MMRLSTLALFAATGALLWSENDNSPNPNAADQHDPFGVAAGEAAKETANVGDNPFGGDPSAEDPFAGGSSSGDPFGASPSGGPAGSDPFDADPTAKPRTKSAAKAVARDTELKQTDSVRSTQALYPSIPFELPGALAARARIENALSSETDMVYFDETLSDVVDDISKKHEIPIVIDWRALEDYGIGTDTTCSWNLPGVTLRSALRLLLVESDLTYVIRSEILLITTPERAESLLTTRFYTVAGLLPADGDATFLLELIKTLVAPDSWEEVGGHGSIRYVEHLKVLVISHTEDSFPEIDNLLSIVKRLTEQNGQ